MNTYKSKIPKIVIPFLLQPKEKQVYLLLVTRGLTDEAIAKLLGMRRETVKSHLQHVRDKMGMDNRAQLIIQYYTHDYSNNPEGVKIQSQEDKINILINQCEMILKRCNRVLREHYEALDSLKALPDKIGSQIQ